MITMFDILFGPRFEAVYEKREIIDVEYEDISDEIDSINTSNIKLIENNNDDTPFCKSISK